MAPTLSWSLVRTRRVPFIFQVARGASGPVVFGTSTVMSSKVYSITACLPNVLALDDQHVVAVQAVDL